jgi:toxin-antitoxin system PIN domain toxin
VRALLDVNVLIALLDSDHVSHEKTMGWFAENAKNGWASCPLTQNGCVRIMSTPSYPNPLPAQAVIKRLTEACHSKIHEFWEDEVSVLDPTLFDSAKIHGPRQLTDIYLFALAVQRGGCFVTFDGRIPVTAVRKAQPQHLVAL